MGFKAKVVVVRAPMSKAMVSLDVSVRVLVPCLCIEMLLTLFIVSSLHPIAQVSLSSPMYVCVSAMSLERAKRCSDLWKIAGDLGVFGRAGASVAKWRVTWKE